MVKASLIILGILFLCVTFYVLEVSFDAEDKNKVITAYSICNTELDVLGANIPVGDIGQGILGQEEECKNVGYMNTMFSYGWLGYILGLLLLVLGFSLGRKKGVTKEERVTKEEEEKFVEAGEESKEDSKKDDKSEYCKNCGSKLGGHERHCYRCGKKV